MDDQLHRSVGRIEGIVEKMDSDITEIKLDVKALQNFKWRVAGGAAVLSFLIAAVLELIKLKG